MAGGVTVTKWHQARTSWCQCIQNLGTPAWIHQANAFWRWLRKMIVLNRASDVLSGNFALVASAGQAIGFAVFDRMTTTYRKVQLRARAHMHASSSCWSLQVAFTTIASTAKQYLLLKHSAPRGRIGNHKPSHATRGPCGLLKGTLKGPL